MTLNDIAVIGIGVVCAFLIITFAPVVWEDAPKWWQSFKDRYLESYPPRQGSLLAGAVGASHNQSSGGAYDDDFFEDEDGDFAPVSAQVQNGVVGFAEPNNTINTALRIADGRNATHNAADDITQIEQARIDALATLIVASKKKAFQDGRVPETRGLTSLFGVSVSSDPKSEYQRLRTLLKQRLEQLEEPPVSKFNLTPEQAEWRDAMGLVKQ